MDVSSLVVEIITPPVSPQNIQDLAASSGVIKFEARCYYPSISFLRCCESLFYF